MYEKNLNFGIPLNLQEILAIHLTFSKERQYWPLPERRTDYINFYEGET